MASSTGTTGTPNGTTPSTRHAHVNNRPALTEVQSRLTRKAPVRCSVSRRFRRSLSPLGGRGVCCHLGSRLVGDVAAAVGLGEAFDVGVGGRRQRRSAHARGRVLADLAVMLAEGGV